jgi:hypothetical protein
LSGVHGEEPRAWSPVGVNRYSPVHMVSAKAPLC